MSPGEIVAGEIAEVAARSGIGFRPSLMPGVYVCTAAPCNALARYTAYRIATIALWAPLDDEPRESLQARKALAMGEAIQEGSAWMVAAVERGEL